MSDAQQVERFFARIQEDGALGREYNAALSAAVEAAVATTIQETAARNGFHFPLAAARAHLERKAGELSEDQLAAVAGGTLPRPLGFLSNPWVLGGIVAAAIAVPLALDDDDAS